MGSILQNGMLSESTCSLAIRYLSLSTELNSGWGLFYRMECFLYQLAAWLTAIIAEIAFYQWNLQENGIG